MNKAIELIHSYTCIYIYTVYVDKIQKGHDWSSSRSEEPQAGRC